MISHQYQYYTDFMSVFFYGRDRLQSGTGTCSASALVRIPRPKIEELALQAQDVGIFRRNTQLPCPTPIFVSFYLLKYY